VILVPSLTAKPLHEYLVEIPGLADTYYKGEYKGFLPPSRITDETKGMVDEGIIAEVPRGADRSLGGQAIRFSYIEPHSSMKGNTPQIVGHILVNPQYAIQIDGKMSGQYVSCKPIVNGLSPSGLIMPNFKRVSHDTQKAFELASEDTNQSCGVVDIENEWFAIGTKVWWGKESFADKRWPSGFLTKQRNIMAWGEEVDRWRFEKLIKKGK